MNQGGAPDRREPGPHPHAGVGAGRLDLVRGGPAHHAKILITPDIGHIAILAYAAAIVGGITSLPGAVVGGFVIGVAENASGSVHFHQRHRGRAFVAIMVVLLLRPQGLLGGKLRVKSMKTNRIDHALLALMAIALAVLPFYASGYVIYVVNLLLVFVVLALGLHAVISETGQFALSHAAFYGVGIYTAGLISNLWHPPFFVSIVAGGLAALMGYVIGALALRMRDIYAALSTFAFGEPCSGCS